MKATGIIRRIDDLGRIVIPKEIRRQCGITEGTPMEIFISSDGIILKKYYSEELTEAVNTLSAVLDNSADFLEKETVCAIGKRIMEIKKILG